MASLISPGILLRERDITTATIVGAQALTGAIATTFAKGEVGVITEIDSQRALLDTFGLPVEGNAEDWLVASEFLNYGGRLTVVRADTDVKTAATNDADQSYKINTQADFVGQTINELFLARTPGKWGNSAQVIVADRGADVYVEFASDPEDADLNPVDVGAAWTFSNGTTAYVLSWDSTEKKAALVITGGGEPSVGDFLQSDGEDPLLQSGLSVTAATEPTRNIGTFTAVGIATVNGVAPTVAQNATFDVTVAADTSAGETGDNGTVTAGATDGGRSVATFTFTNPPTSGSGTGAVLVLTIANDGNGTATVTSLTGGTGYAATDTITITSTTQDDATNTIGGSTDVVVTVGALLEEPGAVSVVLNAAGDDFSDGDVLVLLDGGVGGTPVQIAVTATAGDTAVTAVYDWWTNTTVDIGVAGLELNLNALGIRPGTSAYASDRGLLYDEVTVAVVDTDGRVSGTVGNVLQTFTSLSKLSDGRSAENGAVYYKDIINDESQYIYAGADTVESVIDDAVDTDYFAWGADSVERQDNLVDNPTQNKFAVLGVYTKQLKFGADDYAYTAGEIDAAYDVFATADQTELDFILMGGSINWDADPETATKLKAAKVVGIADARKDCIAFVSPFKGNQIGTGGVSLNAAAQKANTINFFRSLPSTSYAVFDSGYKQVYDRFNDRFRFIPCNGDVAGLCVNTSQVLADWYSPAGVARGALRNAIKLAYTPSQSDRDDLYTNRINPITVLPGTGVTLFGDKTALASTSAFDRINVRRLFLNLEKRVERLASGVLFEQNDVLTRSSFASAVNSYLAEVQARRGVTDFLVVCDETNNTPDVIDRNEFVAEIFVKAARSINFVSVTFTATKTGVAFSEVVGRG